MKKYLRAFKTQAEYLAFTASTEFILDNVSSCREGDLVYFNSEQCGGQGMHRTISGETYCEGYDKRVYLYKQVSYDGGVTWETTATTSSLVEKNSEDCGYVPPTPPSDWDIIAKFNVTSTSSPTRIASATTGFSKIEIDGVEQPSVTTGYTFTTTGEHTVKYKLSNPTSIGQRAFTQCSGLTSIDIPDSVTSIGDWAFIGCTSLISVTIPDSVTSIGGLAFQDCSSLTSINIPSGVTSIGSQAFYNCTSLTSINIPSGVTSISDYTFAYCSGLTSCTIGGGVTSIGNYAFRNCSSLTSITVNAVMPPTLGSDVLWYTNNCPIYVPTCSLVQTYRTAKGWSSYSFRIGGLDCPTLTATFNITDTTNPSMIASDTSSFSRIEIDGVVQPSVVSAYTFSTTGEHTVKYYLEYTTTGGECFRNCRGLTSCTIGSGVTSIDYYAFYDCRSLTSIEIPDTVTSIGNYAFYNCSGLTSIVCDATTAPTITNYTFRDVKTGGTLTVPIGSSGYNVWMRTGDYYLGKYNWTKVEQ